MYNPQAIQQKYLELWEQNKLFQGTEGRDASKDKMYLLFAFAYPSGSGLHVGHVESMTALDIMARYYRMQGKDVFFPVGWDAFGLPAENYAIKTGVPPVETTKAAINTFRRQIKEIGISYDWANELATCHPGYYHWTQWIFLELFKEGLAYQAEGKVNWCPSCQTVLANEQVVSGECERCGHEVIQKDLKQWYFKITQYRDELISGLDQVDWPKATKEQQLNWIGRSEGIQISFEVVDSKETIDVFTTAPTNWGASFLVLAPEHALVNKLTTTEQRPEVEEYLKQVESRSESDRVKTKEKTGVFTGSYARNHVTGENIPVWIGDFVLAGVGTGAIQACPGHDQRDFEFAKKFGLPIPRVVVGPDGDMSEITRVEQVIDKTMPGKMVNSDFLNGIEYKEALQKTMDYFVEQGWGKRITTYKLRDWLISRQRYWGAPIPIIYDPDGNPHPIKDKDLPWKLATDVDFKPTGESPLTSSQELQTRTESYAASEYADLIKKNGWDTSGKGWRPEYDTMDTFVDSSWYYFRYLSSRDEEQFADSDQIAKWLPVDFYMIGPEHIVLHLLYSRFFTKFLRDQGYVKFDEPFMKMRHQGMILGPDHKKMSKSKGNVINPDDIIAKFGADTLRIYEMFMGPIEADKPWDAGAVSGMYRFLRRVHDLVEAQAGGKLSSGEAHDQIIRHLHQTIQKVTEDIPALKFNTALAAMMEFLNAWETQARQGKVVLSRSDLGSVIKLLAPFAPFTAEELHAVVTDSKDSFNSVHLTEWPSWDKSLAAEDQVTIAVQVNGKVRDQIEVAADVVQDKEHVIDQAKASSKVQKWLEGKQIKKEIYIPGKIVNLVVG